METNSSVPLFAYLTVAAAVIAMLFISMVLPGFKNPMFLVVQIMLNFCLILILCFFYGMLTLVIPGEHFTKKYLHLLLPSLLILIVWIKDLLIYCANLQSACSSPGIQSKVPYRFSVVLWNTSKLAIAIFLVYMVVNLFPSFQLPFYELYDSDHPIITYLALAFWLAFATLPAETSCYFNLSSSACLPSEKIVFTQFRTTTTS